MYYDKFLPFYMTYADSSLYSRERIQEQEFALMKSYYPETARKIQEKVEDTWQVLLLIFTPGWKNQQKL